MIYLINLILLVIIIYLYSNNLDSSLIKWLVIFNNLIYTVIKSSSKYAIIAVMFTFIADYYLIFTNYKTVGVLCFVIVQYNYMKILNCSSFNFLFPLIIIWFDPLIVSSLAYIIISFNNLRHSFIKRHRSTSSYHLFLAIFLLASCDIFVAFTNINILTHPIFSLLIWIFYIPSQLLFISSQTFIEK